jgi:hypothetical protein
MMTILGHQRGLRQQTVNPVLRAAVVRVWACPRAKIYRPRVHFCRPAPKWLSLNGFLGALTHCWNSSVTSGLVSRTSRLAMKR